MNTKKFYEIDEVLKIIPMSRAGIYQAVKKEEIPSVRVGRRVFVPAWYVERLLTPPPKQRHRGITNNYSEAGLLGQL